MGRSAGPFLQTLWTVSVPMNLASVVGKSHLLTFQSGCCWCGLYLSGRSHLGMETGPRSNWDRDMLEQYCPGKGSQEIESREGYNSIGRQGIYLFLLVCPLPLGQKYTGIGGK